MKAKRKKSSTTVEEHGVRVRIVRRGAHYWYDVRIKGERLRVSAKTGERAIAEANAYGFARELAKQELLSVSPDTLTLGEVFVAYSKLKGVNLTPQWRRGGETRAKMFLAAWGDCPVAQVSATSVDSYCAARRSGSVAPALRLRRLHEGETPRPLRDGALDSDFGWLSSVFNWAVRHRLASGARLLGRNPLHDCGEALPHERDFRRPIASADRYVRTLAKADEVDPLGRLRLILVLARFTGRRESAIIQLRASDVLLSTRAVVQALAETGKDVNDADHMPHGALRWRAETDKQRVLHITAIAPATRAEIERYLVMNPRLGDTPLFPGPKNPALPVSRVIGYRWLIAAERKAELPKLLGGGFHPYRRLWATERKHFAAADVASGGGWGSTKTLIIYQQNDSAAVLAAVVNAPTQRARRSAKPRSSASSSR